MDSSLAPLERGPYALGCLHLRGLVLGSGWCHPTTFDLKKNVHIRAFPDLDTGGGGENWPNGVFF